MAFMLVACGAGSDGNATGNQKTTAPSQSENDSKIEENNQTDALPSGTEKSDVPEENGSKVLVAYFSCTGNTEGIAEKIAEALGADTYEIVPEQPYTDDDLNYSDSSSRSTKEQNDDSCRPAISGSVEKMDGYDTVFIGFPIWWGQAPSASAVASYLNRAYASSSNRLEVSPG